MQPTQRSCASVPGWFEHSIDLIQVLLSPGILALKYVRPKKKKPLISISSVEI
jgi:hypothetical protein